MSKINHMNVDLSNEMADQKVYWCPNCNMTELTQYNEEKLNLPYGYSCGFTGIQCHYYICKECGYIFRQNISLHKMKMTCQTETCKRIGYFYNKTKKLLLCPKHYKESIK